MTISTSPLLSQLASLWPIRVLLGGLASLLERMSLLRSPRGRSGDRLATLAEERRTVSGGKSDITPDPQTMGRGPSPTTVLHLRSKSFPDSSVCTLSGTAPGSRSDIRPTPETGGAPDPTPVAVP